MTDEPTDDDSVHPSTTIDVTQVGGEPSNSTPEIQIVLPAEAYEALVVGATGEPLWAERPLPSATQGVALGEEVVEAIETLGNRIEHRLDQLQNLFDREIRAEATREKVVDRLHAELQEYKQDLLLNTLRPMFIDLIQLHDDIGKVAVVPEGLEEESEARRLVELMRGFQQGIEDVLYRQGVEPFHAEGEAFDPKRQRAVNTVTTDDPALFRTIATRLRKGFRSGERVIRPEIVSVYAAKKPEKGPA